MPATGHLPIQLTVWDKTYTRRGALGAPLTLELDLQFNAAGQLTFTLPAAHPRVVDLVTEGARVVCSYQPDTAVPAAVVLSGGVQEVGGGGPRGGPWRRFRVVDDWSVLAEEVQCWPNPSGTVMQQGDEGAYFTRTGPAETVLKSVLAPNVARQGTALAIPPTAGRGATITGSVRFHTVTDRLFPAVEQAGIGIRVVQVGAQRQLDTYVPTSYPRVLTEASGVVTSGEYAITRPTVTRVLVAAGGEGTARVLRQKIDETREAAHGVVLPAYRDARDVAVDSADFEAVLQARMDETLAEGAPKASLKCELTESARFRFGVTFGLGDRVSIKLNDAPVITELVRAVAITWSVESGVIVTPRVGEWSDTADATLFAHVQALTKALKDLQRT